jgi:hypothetical protein
VSCAVTVATRFHCFLPLFPVCIADGQTISISEIIHGGIEDGSGRGMFDHGLIEEELHLRMDLTEGLQRPTKEAGG